ncbi:MAG: SDR family NAD(P)-dependent oxidoreductase [Pseudomonadota bacterium]
MDTKTPPTALITGASSGFGESLAQFLLGKGYRIIGTSRRAPADGEISATGLIMVELDVNDNTSVTRLAERLMAAGITPDVLVLNAGIWGCAPIEETSMEMAREQFETNFFGVHRVVQALLPMMRLQTSGHIIFIGSLGAQIAVPFQGFYSASKAALAVYAETLTLELAAFDIDVSLVEPGNYNTGIGVVDLAGAKAQKKRLRTAIRPHAGGDGQSRERWSASGAPGELHLRHYPTPPKKVSEL